VSMTNQDSEDDPNINARSKQLECHPARCRNITTGVSDTHRSTYEIGRT